MCIEQRDRRCTKVFQGKKQTSLSTRASTVIVPFIWFPAYQGEHEKIYINIDVDRRATLRNDVPILD